MTSFPSAGVATVKQVISGDTLVLVGTPKGGPPPERQISLASIMAPRVAFKSLQREVYDEPYGWAAREALRKMVIGKQVTYSVDFNERERDFGNIIFNGENVSIPLLKEGLVKVKNSKPPNAATNMDELRAAESIAKEEFKGLWSEDIAAGQETIRNVQYLINDDAAAKAFVNLHKGKKLNGIIEFIRDGRDYKIYFPEQMVYATILLAGVQVDSFKRSEGSNEFVPEPFAVETKFFVEIRLLNRNISVRIESADDYGNIYGSLYHPNGNIGVLLLKNGFGKIQDWSCALTENPSALVEAVVEAQKNRLRRWRSWQPITSDLLKDYPAKVIEVVSADCIIVEPLETARPIERRLYLASIRSPRLGNRNRPDDEPWAFEAKEFVRRKLIGRKVQIAVEYTREQSLFSAGGAIPPPASDEFENLHFVTVHYESGKGNLNEDLVAEGLARTLPHRADDARAVNFCILQQKEKEAIEKKKGMHSCDKDSGKSRINDLLGPNNAIRAKSFEPSLKRLEKIDGVVEHIFSGGRFKIRLPSQGLAISFALGGIRVPQSARAFVKKPAEEFGPESLQFARETLMQRQVLIHIDVCDKGGNFIGTLWYGPKKECFNVATVAHGLARTVEFSLDYSPVKKELIDAETYAKERRLGIWSMADALDINKTAESVGGRVLNKTIREVEVVLVNSVVDFFIQESSPAVSTIHSKIQSHIATPLSGIQIHAASYSASDMPKKGEFLLAQFSEDNEWYRATVESVDRAHQSVTVFYVDFGNKEVLKLDKLKRGPADFNLSKVEPLSKRCALAGLKQPIEMENSGAAHFATITAGNKYRCLIESYDQASKTYAVYLYPLSTHNSAVSSLGGSKSTDMNGAVTNGVDTVSLNELLLETGYACFDKKSTTSEADVLKNAEMTARKRRLNVWKHGDIDGDSDRDD